MAQRRIVSERAALGAFGLLGRLTLGAARNPNVTIERARAAHALLSRWLEQRNAQIEEIANNEAFVRDFLRPGSTSDGP